MEENISKYELYILKEAEGGISPTEKEELEAWLKDPPNKSWYLEQKKLLGSIEDLRRMEQINRKKALREVEKQISGKLTVTFILRKLERGAAILFLPLFLAAIWNYLNPNVPRDIKDEEVYNTVEVPSGVRSSINLPDGTFVWLNSGSSLKYPVRFGKNERQVDLIGEAYFDVKKNSSKPFIVSTNNINIKVLGTSFNCCAYKNEGNVETALVEGEVEISGKTGKNKIIMKPGEVATFFKNENKIKIKKADLDKYVAWKSGKLLFRDDPMDKVLNKLGRWYNVDFQVEDKELLGYVYSATFTGESLDQMLKMISLSAPIKYQILERNKTDDNVYEKQVIKLTIKPGMNN